MGLCCSGNSQPLDPEVQKLKNLREATIYNCKVRLMSGNILAEDTDAIMTQCDLNIYLSSPLTNQIRRRGGKQIFQELQRNIMQDDELDYGDVVYTHAGDLDFEYIFFGILPYFVKKGIKQFDKIVGLTGDLSDMHKCQKQYIYHCISNVLQKAEDLCLESVSLPVLGQDLAKFTIGVTAMIMILAIKIFLEENQNNLQYLKLISIPVEAQDEIDAFTWYFKSIIEHKEGTHTPKYSKLLSMQEDVTPQIHDDQQMEISSVQFGHSYSEFSKRERKESI